LLQTDLQEDELFLADLPKHLDLTIDDGDVSWLDVKQTPASNWKRFLRLIKTRALEIANALSTKGQQVERMWLRARAFFALPKSEYESLLVWINEDLPRSSRLSTEDLNLRTTSRSKADPGYLPWLWNILHDLGDEADTIKALRVNDAFELLFEKRRRQLLSLMALDFLTQATTYQVEEIRMEEQDSWREERVFNRRTYRPPRANATAPKATIPAQAPRQAAKLARARQRAMSLLARLEA